jgi:hypothetical protein
VSAYWGAEDNIHLKYEESVRGRKGHRHGMPEKWTKHVKNMHKSSTIMKISHLKTAVVAAIMICCVSCHREGPTVAEEICQVRDSLLDKNMACVCFYPPECRTLTPG